MTSWLLLDVELQFVNQYRVIHSRDYRPDVITDDGSATYYGMHFISAPAKINPGDRVTAKIMLRAFPKDPCLLFQPGKKIFVKEGPVTRAEGIITERTVHESPAKTILEVQQELFKNT
jgi:hypothetical protein